MPIKQELQRSKNELISEEGFQTKQKELKVETIYKGCVSNLSKDRFRRTENLLKTIKEE